MVELDEKFLYHRVMFDCQSLFFWAAFAAVPLFATAGESSRAMLILHNAAVATMNERAPQARAVAVSAEGKILAVGSDEQIMQMRNESSETVDCGGRLLLPGFMDAHGHFLGLGKSKLQLDLAGEESFEKVIEAAGLECSKRHAGEWVIGRGWHQEKWKKSCSCGIEYLPSAKLLEKACPKNPVLLVHASGHAAFANRLALQAAGAWKRKKKGVVCDPFGKPTGTLLESAVDLIYAAYEKWQQSRPAEERERELLQAAQAAVETCQRNGVTFFQDAGSSFREIDFLSKLAESDSLGVRLWVMIAEDNAALSKNIKDYKILNRGQSPRLWVRAIKRYADGALGSHGAWLISPYDDMPKNRGMQLISEAELAETAKIALENGFQLCTHAIGDRANRFVLDVYEKALSGRDDAKELRWRIEHAQHIDPADIPRFSRLGIIASMQAAHCVSDGPWVEKRIGKKRAANGAYVWRSLLDSGALIANGTDTPVEPENPIAGFYAFVSRRLSDGRQFYPQQSIGRLQALKAMTLDAARAAFAEDMFGSIEPGKYADLVLLSQNILAVDEDHIPQTAVSMTVFNGKIVFKNF